MAKTPKIEVKVDVSAVIDSMTGQFTDEMKLETVERWYTEDWFVDKLGHWCATFPQAVSDVILRDMQAGQQMALVQDLLRGLGKEMK